MTAAENQVSGAENHDKMCFFFSGMGAQAHRTAWWEESEVVSNFSFLLLKRILSLQRKNWRRFLHQVDLCC